MNKKEYLELLIKSYGLKPQGVQHYRTNSMGGEYEIGFGWRGEGVNEKGVVMIRFAEPDGFNMAVYEILKQCNDDGLDLVYVDK